MIFIIFRPGFSFNFILFLFPLTVRFLMCWHVLQKTLIHARYRGDYCIGFKRFFMHL